MQAKEVIKLATARLGSQQKLAQALGVSQQAVNKWQSKGVPASRVLAFEKCTGIARFIVRPDIYPPTDYQGG